MGRLHGKSSVLLSALASGALAAGTLGGSPTANATCISAFGLNNGNGCNSNLTSYAIAIGPGAVADSSGGVFSGAFAVGSNAQASVGASAFIFATALGNDAKSSTLGSLFGFNTQVGRGEASTITGALNLVLGISLDGSTANTTGAIGLGNIAMQIGPGITSTMGALNLAVSTGVGSSGSNSAGIIGLGNIVLQLGPGKAGTIGSLNLALGVGHRGSVETAGLGNIALDFLGREGNVAASGILTSAVNVLGANTRVSTSGVVSAAQNWFGQGNSVSVVGGVAPNTTLGFALNLFGTDNTTTAGPGPLAIAASFFDTGATVTQTTPGINIGFAQHTRAVAASGDTSAASRGIRRVTTSTPNVSVGATPTAPTQTVSISAQQRRPEAAAVSTGGKHRKVVGGKHRA
jgi:hypothetical protein